LTGFAAICEEREATGVAYRRRPARRSNMRTLRNALLLVVGVALFVGLVANPIADAIGRARLGRLGLRIVADTDLPGIADAAKAASADIETALKACGVRATTDRADSSRELELVVTVHGFARCRAGTPADGAVMESVELRLCGPPTGTAAASPDTCAPQWWRATPLVLVSRGAPLPIRNQVLGLVDEFIAEHHLPVRPEVPNNPRHIGWR
jgi:hypothetical protein